MSTRTQENDALQAHLNAGIRMPRIGFGTWELNPGEESVHAVQTALETGYRLIDTAMIYRNEADVGKAIARSGIPREEIFVTTKLWNTDHGYAQALEAFELSRQLLGMSCVDLYLIHWPAEGDIPETWRAMQELQESGKVRAIGVSNFGVDDLKELLEYADIPPAVNQIRMNVFDIPRETATFCAENGILVEAYSPLNKAKGLDDPVLTEIAAAHQRTPAQIMLRWVLQHQAIAIPRSHNPERIRENFAIDDFALSELEMVRLSEVGM